MATAHGSGRADQGREQIHYSEVAQCSFDAAPALERLSARTME
jgi:hypothetical protein